MGPIKLSSPPSSSLLTLFNSPLINIKKELSSPSLTTHSTPSPTSTENSDSDALSYTTNSNYSTNCSHICTNNCTNNCTNGLTTNNNGSSRVKRKINFASFNLVPNQGKGAPQATVARRNARERNRVKQVNNGFAALKQHIPLGHRSKKMSKVETLRCAVDYIRNLQSMLGDSLTSSNSPNGPNGLHSPNGPNFENSPNGPLDSPNGPPGPPGLHNFYYYEGGSGESSSGEHSPQSSGLVGQGGDYENYEPLSPEDDELIECISWWQQS